MTDPPSSAASGCPLELEVVGERRLVYIEDMPKCDFLRPQSQMTLGNVRGRKHRGPVEPVELA